MKYLVIFFLMLSVWGDNLKKVSRINNLVQEAEIYYQEGQYQQAAQLYNYLLDSLKVSDKQLLLNLAHATYMDGDLANAQKTYTALTKNTDPGMQSVALTQLGLIFFEKENPEKALYHFRKALIQNPFNETARYNYELAKKYLSANPSINNPDKKRNQPKPKPAEANQQNQKNALNQSAETGNKNQSSASTNPGAGGSKKAEEPGNQDNQNLQQKNDPANQVNQGEKGNTAQGISGENGNNRLPNQNKGGTETLSEAEREMQTLRARLKDSHLSPEKAKMLLEAMRNAELQYLQQLPRKQTKSTKQNGPDW